MLIYKKEHILLLTLVSLFLGCVAFEPTENAEDGTSVTRNKIVFGSDDRYEYGSISDDDVLRWADSTAIMMDIPKTSWCNGTSCTIATTLDVCVGGLFCFPVCANENFSAQSHPSHAWCTAFLVGPKLFATAGHCINTSTCSSRSLTFKYVANTGGQGPTSIDDDDVYQCTNVKGRVLSGDNDWAIFEVDRIVERRVPFFVRYSGKVSNNQDLVTIGHPRGLPLKVDEGGEVKDNTANIFFTYNLDMFEGSSGSPVINNKTGVVEAIHAQGENGYLYNSSQSCWDIDTCSDSTGCSTPPYNFAFQEGTRITLPTAENYIPLHYALISIL